LGDFSEVPAKVGGVIPNFFFDAIGRIVPGTYLVMGMLSAQYASRVEPFIRQIGNSSLTVVILLSLCLLSLGYIAGFLLGAVSYWVEWAMSKNERWSLATLRERFGGSATEETRLERLFRDRFGFDITDDHAKIQDCSWLCAYFVWAENPQMGSMSSRWDAEALAARGKSPPNEDSGAGLFLSAQVR
jgi:hypothetical protein